MFFVNCHMFGRYWNGEGCRGAVSVSGREEVPSVESEFLQGDLLPQWLQVKWQMHESLLKREQEDIVLMPSHFQFSYENSSPEKCQRASSSFPQVQQVQHLALSFVKGISALV